MLKTIYRTAVILLVIGLVAGGLYLLAQDGAFSSLAGSTGRGQPGELLPGDGVPDQQLFGDGDGGGEGAGDQLRQQRRGGGRLEGRGLGERHLDGGGLSADGFLRSLVVIAVVTLAVVALQKLFSLFKRKTNPA